MTDKQLSTLLDISGDYVFLRCLYDYEAPETTSVLFHADECNTDFIVTILNGCEMVRCYFYDSEIKKNFEIRNIDGHIDWGYSSYHLGKDVKAVLDFPISLLYLGIRRILSIYEDDIPF